MKKRKLLCLCALILTLTACLSPVSTYGEYVSQWTDTEEIVSCSRVEEWGYNFATSFPEYSYKDCYIPNACGPVAGANIIGYYDRDYPNMISGYQGSYDGSVYYDYVSDFYIEPTISDLAVRMGTDAEGTTYIGFKRGLAAYISAAGYKGSFRDVVAAGNFYYNTFVDYIEAGYPVALFLGKQNLITWSDIDANTRHFTKSTSPYAHVMVAYGYRVAKFYALQNGAEVIVRSDIYLRVTDGYGMCRYILWDNTLQIDDGFAVMIENNN